jgi:hypothetical protein
MQLLASDRWPSENRSWFNLSTKLLLAVNTTTEDNKDGTYIATYTFCPLDLIEIVTYISAAKIYGFDIRRGDCVRNSLIHRGQENIIPIIHNPANNRNLLGCLLKGGGEIAPSFPPEITFKTYQHYKGSGPFYMQVTKNTWDVDEKDWVNSFLPLGETSGPVNLPQELRKRRSPENEEGFRKKTKTQGSCGTKLPSPAGLSDPRVSPQSSIQKSGTGAKTLSPELVSTASTKPSPMVNITNSRHPSDDNDSQMAPLTQSSIPLTQHGGTPASNSTPQQLQPMSYSNPLPRPPLLHTPLQTSTQPSVSTLPICMPTQKPATVKHVLPAPKRSSASTEAVVTGSYLQRVNTQPLMPVFKEGCIF